jgi:Thioredoxin
MSVKRIMDVVIIALSAAILAILVSAVRRSLPRQETAEGLHIRSVPDWHNYIGGHLLRTGPPNARRVVIEFGDFECPFCARFAHVLDTVAARVPGGVRVYFRHYPLQMHAYAHAAAIASECAAEQGRFEDFYHLAYESGKPLSLILDAEPKRLPDAPEPVNTDETRLR